MNIAILGLTATSYGSLTYLKSFLPHLAQLDRSNHYEVYLPAGYAHPADARPPNFRFHFRRWTSRSGTLRVLWEQLVLPWILRAQRIDAVYTTHNMAILLSPIPSSIIILQNVEPFFAGQFPNALHLRPRLWLLRKMTELSLRRSRKIIAISEWEKEFLVERFNLPPDKIMVSYPGVTEGFRPPAPGSVAARQLWGEHCPSSYWKRRRACEQFETAPVAGSLHTQRVLALYQEMDRRIRGGQPGCAPHHLLGRRTHDRQDGLPRSRP